LRDTGRATSACVGAALAENVRVERGLSPGEQALIFVLRRAGESWPTWVRLPGRPVDDGGLGPPRDLPMPRLLAEAQPTRRQLGALLMNNDN